MCMIYVPICVLPLHRNHRFGGIDHVHINDLAAALLSIGISTPNSKLQTNSSSSPRTFMSLPHTQNLRKLGWKYQIIVWEWWISHGFKSNVCSSLHKWNHLQRNTRVFNPTPRRPSSDPPDPAVVGFEFREDDLQPHRSPRHHLRLDTWGVSSQIYVKLN